jgi:hypothetical protein
MTPWHRTRLQQFTVQPESKKHPSPLLNPKARYRRNNSLPPVCLDPHASKQHRPVLVPYDSF